MSKTVLYCYHCDFSFTCEYFHSGFGDEVFFYCDSCGMVANIDMYQEEYDIFFKKYITVRRYNANSKKDREAFEINFDTMLREISINLNTCACGGKFTVDAIPRCPSCNKELEWDKVVPEIDRNSGRLTEPKFRECLSKGWHDIYYFVFNNRQVRNNWQKTSGGQLPP